MIQTYQDTFVTDTSVLIRSKRKPKQHIYSNQTMECFEGGLKKVDSRMLHDVICTF